MAGTLKEILSATDAHDSGTVQRASARLKDDYLELLAALARMAAFSFGRFEHQAAGWPPRESRD